MKKNNFIKNLKSSLGSKYVLTAKWEKHTFSKGWRYGEGEALAVVKPGTLFEIWNVLKLCVEENVIVIMQAANTGLTGGSTPFGDDYDRPIVIINTMRVNDIHIINEGKQIIGLAGSTLFGLENELDKYGREPHSVIGSSCIGASIVGGVCNNSGGALVKRGPAYTELSLYAKINLNGQLELVNDLGVDLGNSEKEILENLQSKNYNQDQIQFPKKLASDNEYKIRIRDVDAGTPARYNADKRRLYAASGCAGKVAVFAVRLDTYLKPAKSSVFYIGSNNPENFSKIRRDMLSNFKNLPDSGEYVHRDCYDAAKRYSKDTFVAIEKLGPSFIPKLFEFKRKVDLITGKFRFLPSKFSDKLMQFLSLFWPNHLPSRMEDFHEKYEHHWIIEMSDEGIDEIKNYLISFFEDNEGSFFECNEKEAGKALLHRFVAASAVGRFHALNENKLGEMISLDIAFPRNEKNWFENLPREIENQLEMKLYYGHLFCHVLHHNYIVKKGVDADALKERLLKIYDDVGAEYPAEHNVGHEYLAKPSLTDFYKELDPTNGLNPGIGQTSKNKYWK